MGRIVVTVFEGGQNVFELAALGLYHNKTSAVVLTVIVVGVVCGDDGDCHAVVGKKVDYATRIRSVGHIDLGHGIVYFHEGKTAEFLDFLNAVK